MKYNKSIAVIWAIWLISIVTMIEVSHAKVILPAEVLGRSLNAPGLGWVGHVAIATRQGFSGKDMQYAADQVIEVLNEPPSPVIQFNWINTFKGRSSYWGSRYGVVNNLDTKFYLLKEAFHQSAWCPRYTIYSDYDVGTGIWGDLPEATHCGTWRCDTFIFWAFYNAGFNIVPNKIIWPKPVFDAFPYSNGDSLLPDTTPAPAPVYREITDLPIAELNAMTAVEFVSLTDIPRGSESEAALKYQWDLVSGSGLSDEKKSFLLDKLSLRSIPDAIERLLALYPKASDTIKNNIISTTMFLYQNNRGRDYTQLQKFYYQTLKNPIKDKLETVAIADAIRGYIDLTPTTEIAANQALINKALNTVDPRNKIMLMLLLISKSSELEHMYIPKMIAVLEKHQDPDLDSLVFMMVVDYGKHLKNTGSREQIKEYALKSGDRYANGADAPQDSSPMAGIARHYRKALLG